MKIVVLDGYTENPGDLSWEGLQEMGELTVYDRTPVGSPGEIIRRIGDAQAVFTNKTPLTKEVFEACGHIRYVGVLATGYNVVDCEAASAKGIPVCNIPTYGTDAVAQYTIALLLEICHHIGHHSQLLLPKSVGISPKPWRKRTESCRYEKIKCASGQPYVLSGQRRN